MVSMLMLWSIDATLGQDSAWVELDSEGLVIDGRIAARRPEPHTVAYHLEVDADSVTRALTVDVRRAAGASSVDVRNEAGRWTVDGLPRPDLDGAVDVDVAGCPLTNVMPIRRHDLVRRAGSHDLLMAFVDVPELRVLPDRQRYTHVRTLDAGGAIVRYESGDFRSDLTVDADGFVLDYPRLGRRVGADRIDGSPSATADAGAAPSRATMSASDRAFMAERRTATLATLSADGRPRLVPVCFVLADPDDVDPEQTVVWSPLDEKPKRASDVRDLARVRDIVARPEVTLLFERWSEDWTQLAWLRAVGNATLVEPGDDVAAHRRAVEALRARYPQYRSQSIEQRPMIRIDVTATTAWSAAPREG